MSVEFRPGARERVGLLVGLIGSSGSGKTFSAMRLASGICGDKPFAVIDTEARRALHYADRFRFDHAELKPPFRPDTYAAAIKAADDAGYPVVLIDSFSHVWAGEGGVLDWHEDELQRMAGNDWQKREACKMAAWIKPKMGHKAMVQRLLQIRAHLIICSRAEEKVELVKIDGKTKIVPKGWQPICDKNFPYELTCSFLLLSDAPGVPRPIKLQDQHKPIFPLDQPVSEKSGEMLAAWAAGGASPKSATKSATQPADDKDWSPEIDQYMELLESRTKTRAQVTAFNETNKAMTDRMPEAAKAKLRARIKKYRDGLPAEQSTGDPGPQQPAMDL